MEKKTKNKTAYRSVIPSSTARPEMNLQSSFAEAVFLYVLLEGPLSCQSSKMESS